MEASRASRKAALACRVSDEQIATVSSAQRAKEQFREELDALRHKYEELGLDFDAAIREHQARKSDDA